MRFAIAALLVSFLAVGAFGLQDEPSRGVDANATYNLWSIRGANGVCATVLYHEGRWHIRAAPGYTVEALHDDRRPSVADGQLDIPAAPALAFPADPVPGAKKGK